MAVSFMLEVGENAGPMEDTALCSRQSPLRLLKLAFCVAYPAAPDAVELRISGHAGFLN